ncbi:MAG: D-glycerate dehydrogenase, partial [Actinomycetota bacterium]
MGKILITDQLDPLALQLISEAGHEFDLAPGPWTASALAARAQGYSAIMGTLSDELGAEVFASPELQVLATVSVGVNHIDLKAAEAAGVGIINTPDVLTDATAELTLAMMLMVLRKTARAEADLRAGNWNGWALNDHLGSQFSTRT